MPLLLQTKNLEKSIKGKKIISNLDLHINKGEIYGFLGPNGAGKTSVIKMLMNFWKPTGGTIEIFGKELTPASYDILKRIGSIIEFPVFYEHLSGEQNLELHCEYMGYEKRGSIEQALDLLELSNAAKMPVSQYSLGMKQRLGIARAILTKPELLILDEPTNGLDPVGMKHLRELFCMLRDELGITIMLSTHILSEIEDIADTVGVINHGKMMKEIAMKDIIGRKNSYIDLGVLNVTQAIHVLKEAFPELLLEIVDKNNIRVLDGSIATQEIAKQLFNRGIDILSIGKGSESLEDYFMSLVGEGERNVKVD
uniref:ABC transporter ATP-binding protein n=1 Tax=Agathobacter sp. TaxID=2021311 RepID=UPI0040565653